MEADHVGNGNTRHLFALEANVNKDGSGSVTEDMISVLAQAGVDAGHVAGLWNFYANPVEINGTALVDFWNGLHIHAPLNNSTNLVGIAQGIQLDIFTNAGTVTKSISSTGNAPSDFAGPVAVPTLRAHTVYSVAGTPLPSAVTEGVGARAFVSDAVANTFNTAYVGSGTNKIPVFSDGTVWRIG